MAGNIFIQPGTLTTLLSDTGVAGGASLTSLASGSAAITTSAGVDNTSRLDFWADFQLTIFFATAPTAGLGVDLYLLPSYDGTNYADGTSGASPIAVITNYIGSFILRGITTKQILTLRGIPIPPVKFNIQLVNSADQAFAVQNTGSTLKVLTYREQYS